MSDFQTIIMVLGGVFLLGFWCGWTAKNWANARAAQRRRGKLVR